MAVKLTARCFILAILALTSAAPSFAARAKKAGPTKVKTPAPSSPVTHSVAHVQAAPANPKTHYGFEFRLASLTKTGGIAIGSTSAGIYMRSIGIDGCIRAAGLIFKGFGTSDLFRFCMGYHTAQIDSARNGTFPVDYREVDVVVVPFTLEPGIRIPTSPSTAFYMNATIRKLLVGTADSTIYELSGLGDSHYGFGAGMETRLVGLDAFAIGFTSYFREGITFAVGFVRQFN
ncbi:MAG: hypothetical protein JST80_01805 [Bdellovibrionales bacterium]|nr:hypothetical protein [Bdellovibrionales bacterium]